MPDETEPRDEADPVDDGKPTPVIPAEQLFGQAREIWIDYLGERYRLRITRRGKLILQK